MSSAAPATAKSPIIISRAESFQSVSSSYSEIRPEDPASCEGKPGIQPELTSHGQQHMQNLRKDCHGEFMATCSRASSSTSGDPFKYDGDVYSVYLQPSAERAISDALHHAGVSSHATGPPAHAIEMKDPRQKSNKTREVPSFYDAQAIRST